MYAQTNIQLFSQLSRAGYSGADLELVRDAYELAMVLFSGRFQPSGKIFIAHVVGTAGILASLRLPAPVVAAGLLHNVYEHGDFGSIRPGVSLKMRRRINRLLGSEVEEVIAIFPMLHWNSSTVQLALADPDKLPSIDRHVLILRLADYLEHLLDLDLLYYSDTVRRYYMGIGHTAVATAQKLGLSRLAGEITQALESIELAELTVDPVGHKHHDASFVVAPQSCRKRLYLKAAENIYDINTRLHQKCRRVLKRVHARSLDFASSLIQSLTQRKLITGWMDPRSEAFTTLFPQESVLERVAMGFQFTEGPVWIEEEGSLLFSDIPGNQILKLSPEGRVSVFRKPSSHSNGLTRDRQGRLIACEHGNRRLSRSEYDGSIVPLAETYGGYNLNSPNDVVVSSDGAIYFTDPSYGIEISEQEQPIQGVYRLSPDGNEISLVAEDFARPNGLAFSPDERKLYINDSLRRHIRIFDVRKNGLLSGGSIFHDLNLGIPGSPDGMKVDVDGRLYCTAAGGVWVFDPSGRHLGTIVTPEKPSNCAWGGGDWCSLYITAVTSVYRIRVMTPGIKVS